MGSIPIAGIMELQEQFVTMDENDVADRSAIFYLKEEDITVLLTVIGMAKGTPKYKFWSKQALCERIERQLKNVVR